MKGMRQLLEERAERIQTIQEAKFGQKQIEAKIVEGLIAKKMFDCFHVNWRKLNAEVFHSKTESRSEQQRARSQAD